MIQLKGELFEAVQNPGVFKDSKIFVDAIPKIDEEEILKQFRIKSKQSHFKLEPFLREYFVLPHAVTSPAARVNESTMESYIDSLWNTLEREPAEEKANDTADSETKWKYGNCDKHNKGGGRGLSVN